ncbi:MAG: rRNA maturation RNase YbeY [Bacilli bacterium]|nr:rRNA maturation RNase YbeY [Bacilli bacterium]
MKINIINQFDQKQYQHTIQLALDCAEKVMQLQNKTINIILVDSTDIHALNKTYRNKDYVTDVLTFPDGYLNNLGDVFVCVPKAQSQALEYGHSFERELGFLVVHGFLHTLGYDHETSEEELIMNNLQNEILDNAKLSR